MSLTKEKWLEAKKAWENILKQSEIDRAQAELYIEAVDKKLKEFD